MAQERSLDSNADKSSSPAFENGNTAQLLEERILQTALSLFAPMIILLCFYREKSNVWCQWAARSACFPSKCWLCVLFWTIYVKNTCLFHVQVSIDVLLYSLMGIEQFTGRREKFVLAPQIPAAVAVTLQVDCRINCYWTDKTGMWLAESRGEGVEGHLVVIQ